MDAESEVRRIIGEKDLYKILNVDKNATEAEIKKKYRKLATIVHPDRCHNENATAAFQKISHAYQTLIDTEKRRTYDQYGDEPPRTQQYYDYRNEELTPEDLFSFFFGVPPDPRRRARARQQRNNAYYGYPGNANQSQQRRQNQNQQEDDISLGMLLSRVLPFFLIILFYLLSSGIIDFGQISLFFSNPASRQNLKGIIHFADPPSSDYLCRSTKQYRAKYCLPNWWINSQRGDIRRRVLRDADSVADNLYEEELRIRCELEKNQLGHEGSKCTLKKKILKN
ncbi:DnaJ (Hsp40), subfamily B, member 12 [Tritrichomonas musculus]|uniref:DnaJ (Hsp40), subfamily B, member 12 n=1 Tax=Tritrichomonas musculus TaxID=1915356 RepID=A0ABR2I5L6_9EUKA